MKRNMWSLAEIHSLTPLLNSLLLEWKNYSLNWPYLYLGDHHKNLKIELKKISKIGHHQYTGNVYCDEKKVDYDKFLTTLADIISIHDKQQFIERVNQSKFCIEEALSLNINHFKRIKTTFKHTETALFVGHSLHPAPKSRSEFSKNDLINFSPEHGGCFKISWFKIHRSIYYQERSNYFNDHHWSGLLSSFNQEEEFFLHPVHPWQKQNILQIAEIKKYLQEGLIIDLGEDNTIWTPTSSVRTVYNENAPYMIKFSLDVKMTNSIRHLLPHELKRGIQIDEVCKDSSLKGFFTKFPHFSIIQEPLYAGILNENHSPLIQTLVMLRENPFRSSDEVCVMATLTQPHVTDGESILKEIITQSKLSPEEWFRLFLEEAISPILYLEGVYGILLGAHQQNLILKLTEGKPTGAYFRDCHGTGFDGRRTLALRENVESIDINNGNVLDKEISHYLFGYYLIINTVLNTIAAISYQFNVKEEFLLGIFRDYLEDLKMQQDIDPSFINYLLHSDKLKHKGNFFCTIKNINENTSHNPLDIYTEIINPIKVFYE